MILRLAAVLAGLALIAAALGSVSLWFALLVPGVALVAVGLLADSEKP